MSRRPKCKAHPDTRHLTEAEWAAMEAEWWPEQADPAEGSRRRIAAAKQRAAAAGTRAPPLQQAGAEVYRMHFGRHSGPQAKTIAEVLADDPGYFKALLSWKHNILDAEPALKDALRDEGVLDDLLAQRPELKRQRAERTLLRAEDEPGDKEHPEI